MDLLESSSTILETNHWYYQTKFRVFKRYLNYVKTKKKLLDIGSGSGVFSSLFLKHTDFTTATAVDINYPKNKTISIQSTKKIHYTNYCHDYGADLILLMDILEHIEFDNLFLSNIVTNSEPETVYFISVPAFNRLFSPHDVYLKHFRRYNRKQLISLVEKSGLTIIKSFYCFHILFFPVALMRILKKVFQKNLPIQSEMNLSPNPFLNHVFKWIHFPEWFINNTFFGLTCACIAVKKQDSN